MVMDMTTGSPIRRILRFFIPVMLGNLLQQFYSMADSAIVSRTLGINAFAGVTATGALNFLILGFALGICSGFAIPVSQEFGAGNHSAMRRCFANALYTAGVIAVAIGSATSLLSGTILRLIGTPEDILPYSLAYIRVIFAGIPATMLYNLLAGVMRAVGDGRTPLYMLIISTILNVVFDLAFIIVFHMGIAGAAYATILSQLISGLLCAIVIRRKFSILQISGDEWQYDFASCKRLLGIGLPMGLQFSITAIGSTIIQSAVNSLGSQAVAAIGTGARVQFVFTTPLEAIGVTMATYCGQNLGARRIDRVRTGVRQITIVMLIYCICAFALELLVGRYIALLFVDAAETLILGRATLYLSIVIAMSPLLAIVLIYRNAIQGVGYSRVAMIAGLMELIGRAFVAWVLVGLFDYTGACFANPIAWFCADIFLVPAYFVIIRKLERENNAKSQTN
ncbi:MAG: MATE family efflux transporter [Clostridia bacterium]|nr:MATE family efflux transporter [Clostridia bacterium]